MEMPSKSESRSTRQTKPLKGDVAGRLSRREIQVLKLLAEGFRTKDIAAKLGIALNTARVYREGTLSKLGVHNTVSALQAGVQQGIIDLSDLGSKQRKAAPSSATGSSR
jgi:DNA-binding NarL/FixJ family response regulator